MGTIIPSPAVIFVFIILFLRKKSTRQQRLRNKEENESLDKAIDNEKFRKELDGLRVVNVTLNDKNQFLTSRNNFLRTRNATLKYDNASLRNDNCRLKTKQHSMIVEISSLKDANLVLKLFNLLLLLVLFLWMMNRLYCELGLPVTISVMFVITIVYKKSQAQEPPKETNSCVVCLTSPRKFLLLNCRHYCLCETCMPIIRQRTNQCPVCRAKIDKIVSVYTP